MLVFCYLKLNDLGLGFSFWLSQLGFFSISTRRWSWIGSWVLDASSVLLVFSWYASFWVFVEFVGLSFVCVVEWKRGTCLQFLTSSFLGFLFVWWKNPNSLFSSLFHPFWCQLSSVTVRSAHYWHGWTGCVVTCVLSLLRWVLKPDVVDLIVEFLHWSSWVHLLIGLVFLLLYHWNYAVSFASR